MGPESGISTLSSSPGFIWESIRWQKYP